MSTYIDGIAASENIDSSGEVVSIAGMDISMLDKTGVFNFEHDLATGPNGEKLSIKLPSNIVGKILKAKKIFSEQDCEDDRQLYYWNKCQTPFVYAMGELLDDYKDSAKEVAGMFKYDADRQNQNEHDIIGFSIEGGKIAKEGMVVTRSIARKLTITVNPCNKMCIAEMMPSQGESQVKDDIDNLFRSENVVEIQLFKSDQLDQKYVEFLAKKEEAMKKADTKTLNGPAKAPLAPEMGGKTTTAGRIHGWHASIHQHSNGTNVNFEHPEHGMVTVHKNPEHGHYEVKHNGAPAGLLGNKGVHAEAKDAIAHAKNYIHAVNTGKTAGKRMMNFSSTMGIGKKPPLQKALDAGSSNIAPSQLTGGAALGKESLEKGITGHEKGVHLPVADKKQQGTSVMGTHVRKPTPGYSKEAAKIHASVVGREIKAIKPKLEKSEWLDRATEEYKNWDKKEQFETFMQKRLPHLTKGEVEAIGKTVALKKSIDAEKFLGELIKSENDNSPKFWEDPHEKTPKISKKVKAAAMAAHKKLPGAIDSVQTERDGGHWLHLKGHTVDNPGQHSWHSPDEKGLLSDIKSIKPCTCKDCKK